MLKIADIDKFDLFDLVGLHHLNDEKKIIYLQRLENEIVRNFLSQLILKTTDKEELKKIESLLKEKSGLQKTISYIEEFQQNFYEEFIDFVRQEKIGFILDYYKKGVIDCEEKLDIALKNNVSEKNKIALKKKLNIYLQAIKHIHEENWEKLKQLVNS